MHPFFTIAKCSVYLQNFIAMLFVHSMQAFIGKHVNNHTDNFNRVTFVTRELMSHEGPILTKCFVIRKYHTSYWNINMKAHWRGFMSILNLKAVFTLYQMPPVSQTCLPIKLSCDCRNLAVNSRVSRKLRPRKLRPQTLKTQTLWVSRKLRP